MSSDAATPLMRQYHAIKQQVPHALLMFRLGDFYELFYEDAKVAARELEITLTARNKEKGQAVPMCGVPYHAAESYIARLIQKGYRVAICDQMEDPRFAKKVVWFMLNGTWKFKMEICHKSRNSAPRDKRNSVRRPVWQSWRTRR